MAFSFQTSSRDKIGLQLYSQKQLGYRQNENGESLIFASKEGYKFRFETNGLSERDKAEIADAMKKIEPMINKFIQGSGSNSFLKEPLDMVAANINAALPKLKDDNAKTLLVPPRWDCLIISSKKQKSLKICLRICKSFLTKS